MSAGKPRRCKSEVSRLKTKERRELRDFSPIKIRLPKTWTLFLFVIIQQNTVKLLHIEIVLEKQPEAETSLV